MLLTAGRKAPGIAPAGFLEAPHRSGPALGGATSRQRGNPSAALLTIPRGLSDEASAKSEGAKKGKGMEIIEELQGWKEVRIRLQGLKVALESVKLSRLKSESYQPARDLMKQLKILEQEAINVPLRILAEEASSLRSKINGMLNSCESLGILPPDTPSAP